MINDELINFLCKTKKVPNQLQQRVRRTLNAPMSTISVHNRLLLCWNMTICLQGTLAAKSEKIWTKNVNTSNTYCSDLCNSWVLWQYSSFFCGKMLSVIFDLFFKCLEVFFLCLTFSLHLRGLGNFRFRGSIGVLCFSGCTQHRRDPCYDADIYFFGLQWWKIHKRHFPRGKIWHSYKAISRTTTSSVFRWNFQL